MTTHHQANNLGPATKPLAEITRAYLLANPGSPMKQIAEETGVNYRQLKSTFQVLVKRKCVRVDHQGMHKGALYYWIFDKDLSTICSKHLTEWKKEYPPVPRLWAELAEILQYPVNPIIKTAPSRIIKGW